MDTFMNVMEWITITGVHKVVLLIGLVLILIGLFRAFFKRGFLLGKSAASALWHVRLCVRRVNALFVPIEPA